MINLMPPEIKQDIFYARRNVTLLRWSGIMVLFTVGVSAIMLFGTFYISNSAKDLQANVDESNNLIEKEKLAEIQKKTEEISNNMNLMLQVLSKRVIFSSLIRQIGAALPDGTQIATLTLADSDTSIKLEVQATDFATATQAAINLQDPAAKLFSKVDVETLDCISSDDPNIKFHCSTRIRGLFSDSANYRFIKPEAKK